MVDIVGTVAIAVIVDGRRLIRSKKILKPSIGEVFQAFMP